MTLDQGIAAVVAAVLVLASTEWARWRQRKADEKRSELEWIHQVALNEARFKHEDGVRREQWQREERLAAGSRSRESELKRIAATRALCLLTLDTLLEQVLVDTPDTSKTFAWSFGRFPDADVSLLGTPAAQVTYASSTLELLNAHGSRGLPQAIQRAYMTGTQAVMNALREQEDQLNAGESLVRCDQVRLSQVPPDMLKDPAVVRLWLELTRGVLAEAGQMHKPNEG
jgi:hypothetical protein